MIASILQPGQNCWRRCKANEVEIFVDPAAYYESLYNNLPRAQHSLLFLGWEFDSRVSLIRGKANSKPYPTQFGALLKHIAKQRPDLPIYILAWDHATYYLPMREIFQKLKFRWLNRPNIHFSFDGLHPLGASHHQKVVVIDSQLAYCGGIDLTSKRWDTSSHAAKNPARRTTSGSSYGPNHDITVAVTGEAASALYELTLSRLQTAVKNLDSALQEQPSPIPGDIKFKLNPTFSQLDVVISRTLPTYRGRTEVREVEQLFLDMIKDAKRYIYIENQYLTAEVIVDALTDRLVSDDCPEILIVLPKTQSDPLSKYTMGLLTNWAIHKLRKVDSQNKLCAVYPDDPDLGKGIYRNVHAKVLCTDDEYIRIGSANLNNRSMGLDTECDLTLVANKDPEKSRHFRKVVSRLLAHHYHCSPDIAQAVWEEEDLSFKRSVHRLNQLHRINLNEIEPASDRAWVGQWGHFPFVDPSEPLLPEKAADALFYRHLEHTAAAEFFRIVPVGTILTAATAVVAITFTTLFDVSRIGNMNLFTQTLILFFLAGLSLLPFSVVVVLMAAVYGYQALSELCVGLCLAVMVGYGFGLFAGPFLPKLPGRWLPLVDEKLARADFWAIFWARFFPFAPFSFVSFFCGKNRIPFARYFLASVTGSLPYLLIVTVFLSELTQVIAQFQPSSALLLIALLVFVGYGMRAIQRRFKTAPFSH